jgi:hypothetical protein
MRTESIFDTHNLVKRLEHAGFKEKQAEEIVHAISESRQFDIANLATKSDIAILKQDMVALKQEMKADIHQAKYDILKWMIPLMMTIIALIISNKFY